MVAFLASWTETDQLLRLANWITRGTSVWQSNLGTWANDLSVTVWTETA